VGNDGLVVAERAGNQGGGHLFAAVLGIERAVVNRRIGVLNKPRQQADQHGSFRGLGELVGHDRDGFCRGNLTEVQAAHPIGDRKQVSVGTDLVARSGDKRSHRVFVVGSNLAEIACLTKLARHSNNSGQASFPQK
jgi:hypothetical protein